MSQNPYRLRYTDSGGTDQVIGSFDGNGGEEIAKAQLRNRHRRPNRLAVWIDGSTFGDLPVSTSNFNTSEPQVFWEEETSTGTWTTRFRGYIPGQGSILESGLHKFVLNGFMDWLQKQRITLDPSSNASLVSTDSPTVLDEVVSKLNSKSTVGSYTADYPAEADISGSYPSIDRYRLDETAGVAFRELSHKYGWALMVLPEQDGSSNWKIRYEPIGYSGTVDTVRGGDDYDPATENPMTVREWSKEDTDRIVNKAQVIGTDSSGNKITSDIKTPDSNADNSSSVSDYGERFQRYQLDYVDSKSEADTVAQDIVNRNSDSKEGGVIHQPGRYDAHQANSSFEVIDSSRSVDAVFTCTEQVNFYPENASDLRFTFETDHERVAEADENLRGQRAKLVASGSVDVGGQGTSGVDTGDDSAPVSDSGHDNHGVLNSTDTDNASVSDSGHSDHGVSNSTDTESITGSQEGSESRTGVSLSGSSWNRESILSNLGTDFLWHEIRLRVYDMSAASLDYMHIAVATDSESSNNGALINYWTVDDIGQARFTEFVSPTIYEVVHYKDFIIPAGGPLLNSEYHLNFYPAGATDIDFFWEVNGLNHDHASGSLDDGTGTASVSDSGHGHASGTLDDGSGSASVSDPGHGDSSSGGGHGVDGTTDSKTVDAVTKGDKTDR